jgi:hypothetical protein
MVISLRKIISILLTVFAVCLAIPAAAQTIEINNPTPERNDEFGISVAISGNTAVIGASYENTNAYQAGSIYIYDVTTGGLLRTINNPAPATDDYFGNSVALSGNIAVIGASRDDVGSIDVGSAYIYNVTTGALLHTINNPTPAANGEFGTSVAISGNLAIIGKPSDTVTGVARAGSAYVYDVATGALLRKISNPNPIPVGAAYSGGGYFGVSVAISGNIAVIGAASDNTGAANTGSAYIYDVTTGVLLQTINNPTPEANDVFGISVAISSDTVVIGAYGDNTGASQAGSAYIYDVTTGALLQTINNPTPATGDSFGSSVAISGNIAVVSANSDNTGAAYAGSAYIYDVTTGELLQTINNPAPAAQDYFGLDVAISGNSAVVGVPYDISGTPIGGSAYIFSGLTTQPSGFWEAADQSGASGASSAGGGTSPVPEVSATGSLAALVTFLGLMALLWERQSSPSTFLRLAAKTNSTETA